MRKTSVSGPLFIEAGATEREKRSKRTKNIKNCIFNHAQKEYDRSKRLGFKSKRCQFLLYEEDEEHD